MSGYWTNELVLIFFPFYLIIYRLLQILNCFFSLQSMEQKKINLKTLLNNIFRNWLAAMHVKFEILTAKEQYMYEF